MNQKDNYCYKIIASEATIKFIRSKDTTIERLFPNKQFDEWSEPTKRELEEAILDIIFSRPEMTVELHFKNTDCDEAGIIELKNGRKYWKE